MRLSVTKEDASGMQKILAFFRGEVVLTAALVLALLSFLLTPPSAAAFASVDVSTLCMLFALMAVVAGLRSCGLFDWLAAGVKARVRTCRGLGFLLMSLCFFFSMVITNDVALLTFVPFTLLLLADAGAFALMWTVVLETIAANLGSMMTPIGNPQNLYLYMSRGLTLGDFVQTLLPYALVSYILLALGTLLLPGNGPGKRPCPGPGPSGALPGAAGGMPAERAEGAARLGGRGGGGPGRGAPSARFTGQGGLGAAGYVPVLLYLRG